MKTLSIRQPWAWLITNGYKDIENRTWNTHYRGKFLIHASKTFDMKALETLVKRRRDIKWPNLISDFRRGGIVGQAEIVDVVNESESEWFQGPKGFVLKNARPLHFQPCLGKLNFFETEVC